MTAKPKTGRSRQVGVGVGATAVLLVVLVGIPLLLIFLAGWPLPRRMPSAGLVGQVWRREVQPGPVFFLKAFALLFWAGWAVVAGTVAANAVAVVRDAGAPSVPLVGVPVARLVWASALLFVGERNVADVAMPARAPIAASLSVVASRPLSGVAAAAAPAPTAGGPKWVVVAKDDNLWDLAKKHLGNPERCVELADLVRDVPQPSPLAPIRGHGTLIEPGHIVIFPADATGTNAGPLPEGAPPELVARAASLVPVAQVPATRPAATPLPPAPPPVSPPPPQRHSEGVPTPAAASATSQRVQDPDAAHGRVRPRPVVAVELPSGYTAALSFAAGVAAALAAARLRERRRYVPGRPSPGLNGSASPLSPSLRRLVEAARPLGDESGQVSASPAACEKVARTASNPAEIEAGTTGDNAPVRVDPVLGGITIRGPGAEGVTRYLAVALLAHAGQDDVEVVTDAPTAERLFGPTPLFPGLRVLPSMDRALEAAEAEAARRAHLIENANVDDFREHRAEFPEEPLPALVLLCGDAGGEVEDRLQTLTANGARLGIGAITGSAHFECLTAIEADAGPSVTRSDGLQAPEAGSTLHALAEDEAGDALAVVGRARLPADDGAGYVTPAPEPDKPSPAVDVPAPNPAAPIRVRLFGEYSIEAGGAEATKSLRSPSRQLLAWLLLRPDGAPMEAAVAAVWPDTDRGHGEAEFTAAVSELRRRLRPAAGDEAQIIARLGGGRYRVEHELFDVDVWRFESALAAASRSVDGSEAAIGALREGLSVYRAELLEGTPYEWIEPTRAHLRRQAVDAAARIADEAERAGTLEEAVSALECGVATDPFNEEVARRMIRLLGRLGQRDSARAVFSHLRVQLAEIEADPNPETERALSAALAEHGRRSHR
jgi:DNA-binding SARP family transcriptional activator